MPKKVARKAAPKRNYKRGSPYRKNVAYKFKRMAKTSVLYNTTTLGTITTNDNTMVSLSAAPIAEIGGVGYQFGAGMFFRASNVQTIADFTALYDQYRIAGVRVNIIPLSDSANAQNSGFLPTLYWARDDDDALAPAQESELRERQDVKVHRLNKPVSIYIKNPKAMVDVNQTTGLADPAMVKNGWINCASTLVQHNGLKMWFKNVDLRAQPLTLTAFRIETTYYLEFRNPQ